MSMVYDTPRYKHQSLYRILLHLDLWAWVSKRDIDTAAFGNPHAREVGIAHIQYIMSSLGLMDGEEETLKVDGRIPEEEMYDRYAVLTGHQRADDAGFIHAASVGRVFSEFMTYARNKGKKVWCDSDATFRLAQLLHAGALVPETEALGKAMLDSRETCAMAMDLSVVSAVACRLGVNVKDTICDKYTPVHSGSIEWKTAHCNSLGFEGMRLKGMTRDIHEAHQHLRDGNCAQPIESYENTESAFSKMLGVVRSFRFYGFNVLELDSFVIFLDFSSTDQLHSVARMLEGCWAYCSNYRLSGSNDSYKADMRSALASSCKWVSQNLKGSGYSESLPRVMKQSIALLQNEFHSGAEPLDTGYREKTTRLSADIDAILKLPVQWHEHLQGLSVPDRARLDIGNLYYALPAPDCDIQELFARASEYMRDARTVDWDFWGNFLMYCKSLDFCKVVVKSRVIPNNKTEDGYTFEDKAWFRRCMSGKLTLPPDEELGKVWLHKHFPFNDTIATWYLEAGDVTRVDADAAIYSDTFRYSSRDRESSNELLYALKNAPMLSHGYHPNEIYPALANGTDRWDRIAEAAGKCENTKPGSKVRETWSGDDITREATSCFDRTGIPLSMHYAGVTARRGQLHVEEIFEKICEVTRPDRKGRAIIVSNDVSGWSPQADRNAWVQHHDYVCQTSKVPEGFTLSGVWKGIQATCCRRGFLGVITLDRGLFQGWTGTMDTLLNVRLSLYCVREARKLGILTSKEAAHTAGLIDDAVQAVILDEDMGEEHMQRAADRHYEITVETWGKAAAMIDVVKTLYSAIKFIFLNRFFCEGSEVQLPMKVFARGGREFNRRFATVMDQVDAIFGSYRSAVEKGACPVASYVTAVSKCVHYCRLSCVAIKKASIERIVNAAFAPRSLGGWGYQHIGSFLTQESSDPLSSYVVTMASLTDVMPDRTLLKRIAGLTAATLNQEPKVCSLESIIAAPWSTWADGVPDPSGNIMKTIKDGMIKKCESSIFKKALVPPHGEDFWVTLRGLLSCMTVDIAVLALLGQCMPESCSSAIVDRAYKNELVTQLFPYRVRTRLSKHVKEGSRKALAHLLYLSYVEADEPLERREAYSMARECRDKFFDAQKLSVVNHTMPDYVASLARQETAAASCINMSVSPLVRSCRSEVVGGERGYGSMYDAMPKEAGRKGIRTSSVYTFTSADYKNSTPVQQCANKAAIVSAWLQDKGADGKLFWRIVCAAWGFERALVMPVVEQQVKSGTSSKRMDPSKSHRAHVLSPFKNSQSMVNIDATGLGRWLDKSSSHVDFMSYVTAAKMVSLLEIACEPKPGTVKGMGLHFALLPDCLPVSATDIFNVDDFEGARGAEVQLFMNPDRETAEAFMSHLVDTSFEGGEGLDGGDWYSRIVYVAEHLAATFEVGAMSYRAGYVTSVINTGIAAPMAQRRPATIRRAVGEEMEQKRGVSLETRFRQYSRMVSDSQAAITCMAEVVISLTGLKDNMAVLASPWRFIAREFREQFPTWDLIYLSAVRAVRRFVGSLSTEACKALLGNVPHHVVDKLSSLALIADHDTLLIVATLYATGMGRPKRPESYTLVSALGHQYIGRCWRLAAKTRRRNYGQRPPREARYRALIANVYSAMGDQAFHMRTKKEVLVAMLVGMQTLCRAHLGGLVDVPIPKYDLTLPLQNMAQQVVELCIRMAVEHGVDMDIEQLREELTMLATDCKAIGDVVMLQEENPNVALFVTRQEVNLGTMEIPDLGPVISDVPIEGPAPAEAMDESDNEQVEVLTDRNRVAMATAAYIDGGAEFAFRVYDGVDDYLMAYPPLEEEMEEFLEVLAERGGEQEDNISMLQNPEEA